MKAVSFDVVTDVVSVTDEFRFAVAETIHEVSTPSDTTVQPSCPLIPAVKISVPPYDFRFGFSCDTDIVAVGK